MLMIRGQALSSNQPNSSCQQWELDFGIREAKSHRRVMPWHLEWQDVRNLGGRRPSRDKLHNAVLKGRRRTEMGSRQMVYLFPEGAAKNLTPSVLGGKGHSLAALTASGVRVPPGFTVSTTLARAVLDSGSFPKRLEWQLARGISELERVTGRGFGSDSNPLLLSVRSGAKSSMPGMMDTILNLGLTEQNLPSVAKLVGQKKAEAMLHRLQAALPECPGLEPQLGLTSAIRMVLASWDSPRARRYRQENQIPHWWGTAINIQAMVFGNRDARSGTGVVFSQNVATGEPGLYGEFLPEAQGEELVAGTTTPFPLSHLATWDPKIYEELKLTVESLEQLYDDVVDVEFTVESGVLYILQARIAKRTDVAAATIAVRRVWAGLWSKEEAINKTAHLVLDQTQQSFDAGLWEKAKQDAATLYRGLPASPGHASGVMALGADEAEQMAAKGKDVILVTLDTSPDDLHGMLAAKAVVTSTGGSSCHAAVVCRSLNKPAVVGCGHPLLVFIRQHLLSGARPVISVSGTEGVVLLGSVPMADTKAGVSRYERLLASWRGGLRPSSPPAPDWSLVLDPNKRLHALTLAYDFYLTEAMAHAAPTKMAVTRLRDKVHHHTAVRLVTYLTVAVLGELRHTTIHSNATSSRVSGAVEVKAAMARLRETCGPEIFSGCYARAQVQHAAVEVLRQSTKSTQKRLRQVMEDAQLIFGQARWQGGYGGSAWAKIAKAAWRFLSGQMGPTVFSDHAFDLQHNNGTCFGKHPVLDLPDQVHRRYMTFWLDSRKRCTGVASLYRLCRSTSDRLAEDGNSGFPPVRASDEVENMYKLGLTKGWW